MRDMEPKNAILRSLDALTGVWNSTGEMSAPDGSLLTVSGTDSYEWLRGKQFLIHRVDVHVGVEKVDVMEIIGEYNESKKACAMHAFQNDGSHAVMWASLDTNGNLLFADEAIRATLVLGSDGTSMSATWERFDDYRWTHWMNMRFSKVRRTGL